ncbi:hypothetical protein HBH53_220120 [Parastagonospora nodorum]|nr:hypothetical protein HBH53_220120 [Parastagonospora nodorum]KAH4892176.1 hypothetical protein HBH74_213320 [Parastagonospora nodorum]KAH5630572.1 hypothetical protein HBI23_223690 [Parastagonospora nodorum]KAH6497438.1 hypothetical protein HBI55_087620 [Parastagonospora nodorum]
MPHAKRRAISPTLAPYERIRPEETLNGTPKLKRHILIIGAVVSGILLAHHFQRDLASSFRFQITEKNYDVGDTWLENTYPGCTCGVPSDIYQYSFAPSKDWSTLFDSSGEIQNYLSRMVKRFSLHTHIEFDMVVEKCIWDEKRRKWLVNTRCEGIVAQGREADVVTIAAGIFNHYQNPEIPALETFKGIMMHTADWNHIVDLAGKKIGIIGAGASVI